MGDLVPFRRRKKTWTKPEDYRPEDYGRVLPTRRWNGPGDPPPRRGPSRWAAARRSLGAWAVLLALAALWIGYREAGAFHPPGFLEGERVPVTARFTRCAARRAAFCVIDGDTLRVGGRTVRLVGLDAPEVRARCPAEAAGAERAAQALHRWVNAGPFVLAARLDGPADKWGRPLMTARRKGGTAAEALIAQGLARPYLGEARRSWC